MKHINLSVNRAYSCDVLVIGGGVAGISAAICAARNGAGVILAEREGCLGGTASVGLVGPFMSAMDPTGQTQVIRGFFDDFVGRMVEAGGAVHPKDCGGGIGYSAYRIKGHIGVTPFDPECLKLTAEKMCEEAGVKLLYHMLLCSCEKSGDTITSAIFMTKNGLYEINAKVFIDCTGDADLAVFSGAPTVFGDENGHTQVSSVFFTIDGVDKTLLQTHVDRYPENTHKTQRYLEDVIREAQVARTFPCGRSRVSAFESVGGVWRVNMTQYDKQIDFADPEGVTEAEITCRKQIHPLIDFLKKNVPGFANIRLLQSANTLGVRESRRIDGEHMLSIEDLKNGTQFEDAICVVGSAVDFHSSQKSDGSYDGKYYVAGEHPMQVPYRCLQPKKVENLLVAGRCVSADQLTHSAIRVMPPCFAMGEAAGSAAALSVKTGTPVKQINIKQLQTLLRKNGAYLPERLLP